MRRRWMWLKRRWSKDFSTWTIARHFLNIVWRHCIWRRRSSKVIRQRSRSWQVISCIREHWLIVSYQLKIITGAPYVYETVLNNRFRISPSTFFQTNTAGCNVLYSVVADYLKQLKMDHSKKTYVFTSKPKIYELVQGKTDQCGNLTDAKILLMDLCCGCGSIAISLSSYADQVIGIEINADAIEDAKINAKWVLRIDGIRFSWQLIINIKDATKRPTVNLLPEKRKRRFWICSETEWLISINSISWLPYWIHHEKVTKPTHHAFDMILFTCKSYYHGVPT